MISSRLAALLDQLDADRAEQLARRLAADLDDRMQQRLPWIYLDARDA